MWEKLRNKNIGFKIRRQHFIDNYIADFVCINKKVIIEIDGEIHLSKIDDFVLFVKITALQTVIMQVAFTTAD